MSDVTFLELEGHIGIEPDVLHEKDSEGAHKPHPNAGEPGPLTSEAFSYAVSVLAVNPATGKTEPGEEVRSIQILPSEQAVREGALIDADNPDVAVDSRIIPGSRKIETTSPHVVAILTGDGGGYVPCDPPKSQAQTRAKSGKSQAQTRAKSGKGDAGDGSQEG